MMWFAFAVFSALLSAAAAVLQKKILFRLSALEFSFSVSALILAVSLFAPLSVDVAALPLPTLALIVGKSVLGAFAFLLVMVSLQKNQISSALPLLGLTPAAAALLALPLLGESLQVREWAAIGLMIAGTYLIEKRPPRAAAAPAGGAGTWRPRYPIAGAIALFAVSAVADRMLMSGYKVHPFAVLYYQHIVYCFIFGVMLALRARNHPEAPLREMLLHARQHLPLIAAVALITIGYRFAQLEASKDAPAALVLAVKRTSIVFASAYGGTLFSDDRLARKLVGAVLIAGAGFLILRFIA